MNWVYTKIMHWLVGEAEANSSRIKIGVLGVIMAAFALILPHCAPCALFLTPEVGDKLALGIVAVVMKLIHSLDQRDIAAPGETVHGEALPDAEFYKLYPVPPLPPGGPADAVGFAAGPPPQ